MTAAAFQARLLRRAYLIPVRHRGNAEAAMLQREPSQPQASRDAGRGRRIASRRGKAEEEQHEPRRHAFTTSRRQRGMAVAKRASATWQRWPTYDRAAQPANE